MDLRCRLDHNERDWLREKAELLEMFDVERRVWECQLKDMQSKIEELYCDVRVKREVKGGGRRGDNDDVHALSIRSTSTGSSLLSDNEPLSSSSSGVSSMSHCSSVFVSQALKEIARVSEELCSYQDEIRKKSGDKRYIHLPLLRDVSMGLCCLAVIKPGWRSMTLPATSARFMTTFGPWRGKPGSPCHRRTPGVQTEGRANPGCPGLLSEMDTAGPPIPPRSSSWGLSSPTFPDTELYIPESPMMTERKCHSPCGLADKKCSSPSIVRKFEAMLQENEGKVLIDGVVASCSVPANSECVNKGCCHNRWSCDTSKFTSSKLSTYGTVQKSFSEVNIQTAAKVSRSDSCPGVGSLKSPELQIPQIAKELPLNLLLSSLETPPAGPDLQGSRRNVMLEQKTAEFNRTLFQAEMGRGVEKQNRPAVTDDASPPREKSLPPLWTDVTTSVTGVYPEITLSLSAEVQLRRTRYGAEGQEVRTKQGIPSELSSVRPQMGLGETTAMSSQSPARRCEVTHDAQTASGPSRKAEHRAAAEAPISEPGQSVDVSIFEDENPRGAKPQSARAAVSLQQPSAENKQRQMTQPRHASALPSQSDSSRPGPRMMMMNDHPWKALTLAAYPRPEGSRSNYGAVERILKNYESAARAHQSQSRPDETDSSPTAENETELDTPDVEPLALPPTLRHAQTSNSSEKHTAQLSSHSAASVKELHLLVEVGPNFSRPARPANRRLPSRWAGRSPTTSSSPVAPPPFALHKHRSSFSYSHVFHMETVII
uniref:SOGA 1/2-like coiled-coil domain-containing protein n=1 Tax=Cyclopterus lumpus TaxID=8103 RepID=A0A8C2WY84_CYCLU